MKDIFKKWYSKIDKSGDNSRLEHRMKVISEAITEDGAPQFFDYLSYVLNGSVKNDPVMNYLESKYVEYEGEGKKISRQELNVLCCGIVGEFARNQDGDDYLKSNLVLNILSYRNDLPKLLSELVLNAKQSLIDKSISDRQERRQKSQVKSKVEELRPIMEKKDFASASQPLLQTIEILQKEMANLSNDLNVVKEENQLFWWERTKRLNSLNIDVANLDSKKRIICAAFDLYDLSHYHSIPVSAQQLILDAYYINMSKSPKTVSIKDMIEGLSLEIAETIGEYLDPIPATIREYCQILTTLEEAFSESKNKSLQIVKVSKLSKHSLVEFSLEAAVDIALCEISLAMQEYK